MLFYTNFIRLYTFIIQFIFNNLYVFCVFLVFGSKRREDGGESLKMFGFSSSFVSFCKCFCSVWTLWATLMQIYKKKVWLKFLSEFCAWSREIVQLKVLWHGGGKGRFFVIFLLVLRLNKFCIGFVGDF